MAEDTKAKSEKDDSVDNKIGNAAKDGGVEKAAKAEKKAKKTAAVVKSDGGKQPAQPAKDKKEKISIGERFKKFIKDYRSELKKIVWPTREQTIQNTGVVIIAILFMTVVVGVLDLIFGLGIKGLAGIKTLINGG